jgi:hypothetical protein
VSVFSLEILRPGQPDTSVWATPSDGPGASATPGAGGRGRRSKTIPRSQALFWKEHMPGLMVQGLTECGGGKQTEHANPSLVGPEPEGAHPSVIWSNARLNKSENFRDLVAGSTEFEIDTDVEVMSKAVASEGFPAKTRFAISELSSCSWRPGVIGFSAFFKKSSRCGATFRGCGTPVADGRKQRKLCIYERTVVSPFGIFSLKLPFRRKEGANRPIGPIRGPGREQYNHT